MQDSSFVPDAEMPMAMLASRVLEEQMHRVIRISPKILDKGLVRDIHRMRVATRRFRTYYRVFQPWKPESMDKLDFRFMQSLAVRLGAVRDRDIAISLVEGIFQEPRQTPPTFLLSYWADERQAALEQTRDLLRSKRFTDFSQRRKSSSPLPISTGGRVMEEYPLLVLSEWHAAARRAAESDPEDLEALHRLRIRCKRLRYLMEAIHPFCGRLFARLIVHVIQVQDAFGALCDYALTDRLLRQSRAVFTPDELIRISQEHVRRGLVESASEAWKMSGRLFSPSHHATLLSAMAALQKQRGISGMEIDR